MKTAPIIWPLSWPTSINLVSLCRRTHRGGKRFWPDLQRQEFVSLSDTWTVSLQSGETRISWHEGIGIGSQTQGPGAVVQVSALLPKKTKVGSDFSQLSIRSMSPDNCHSAFLKTQIFDIFLEASNCAEVGGQWWQTGDIALLCCRNKQNAVGCLYEKKEVCDKYDLAEIEGTVSMLQHVCNEKTLAGNLFLIRVNTNGEQRYFINKAGACLFAWKYPQEVGWGDGWNSATPL